MAGKVQSKAESIANATKALAIDDNDAPRFLPALPQRVLAIERQPQRSSRGE